MGKETRRNNVYYYRKKREGKRVVSQYIGGGDVIPMAERMAELERWRKIENRIALYRQKADIARIDSMVDKFSECVDQMVETQLLALGYHKHNRQWRLRRG